MTDSNVFKLSQPGTFTDLLTEVLRNGAHALLVQAVETEAAAFLESPTLASKPRTVANGWCATAICRSVR